MLQLYICQLCPSSQNIGNATNFNVYDIQLSDMLWKTEILTFYSSLHNYYLCCEKINIPQFFYWCFYFPLTCLTNECSGACIRQTFQASVSAICWNTKLYIIPSIKKNGPMTWSDMIPLHHMFTSWMSQTYSVMVCGFSLLQILDIWCFTTQLAWKLEIMLRQSGQHCQKMNVLGTSHSWMFAQAAICSHEVWDVYAKYF